MVDDISHEGLRALLREEGASFQRMKTWKASQDLDYAVKKARVEHLYRSPTARVVPSLANQRSSSAWTYADPGTMPRRVRG